MKRFLALAATPLFPIEHAALSVCANPEGLTRTLMVKAMRDVGRRPDARARPLRRIPPKSAAAKSAR